MKKTASYYREQGQALQDHLLETPGMDKEAWLDPYTIGTAIGARYGGRETGLREHGEGLSEREKLLATEYAARGRSKLKDWGSAGAYIVPTNILGTVLTRGHAIGNYGSLALGMGLAGRHVHNKNREAMERAIGRVRALRKIKDKKQRKELE